MDLGPYFFNDLVTPATGREISLHLFVPGVHGLEVEPGGERDLGVYGEPGDRVFDGLYRHIAGLLQRYRVARRTASHGRNHSTRQDFHGSPTFNQPRDVVSSSTTSSGVSFPLI